MYEDEPDEPKSTTSQFGIALKSRDSPIVRAPTGLRDELEIVHHVRSSFDYCAYQTVFRDIGSPKSGTQFPLVDDEKSFERTLKNSMPGVTRKHQSWGEAVRPYNGVVWPRLLKELSNRDKHRFPIDVVDAWELPIEVSHRDLEP